MRSVPVSKREAGCSLCFLRLRAAEKGVWLGVCHVALPALPGFSVQTLLQQVFAIDFHI